MVFFLGKFTEIQKTTKNYSLATMLYQKMLGIAFITTPPFFRNTLLAWTTECNAMRTLSANNEPCIFMNTTLYYNVLCHYVLYRVYRQFVGCRF